MSDDKKSHELEFTFEVAVTGCHPPVHYGTVAIKGPDGEWYADITIPMPRGGYFTKRLKGPTWEDLAVRALYFCEGMHEMGCVVGASRDA